MQLAAAAFFASAAAADAVEKASSLGPAPAGAKPFDVLGKDDSSSPLLRGTQVTDDNTEERATAFFRSFFGALPKLIETTGLGGKRYRDFTQKVDNFYKMTRADKKRLSQNVIEKLTTKTALSNEDARLILKNEKVREGVFDRWHRSAYVSNDVIRRFNQQVNPKLVDEILKRFQAPVK
uniref:RxLR effector protein n=1 Tax=Peronospora matthiolae TaxID=2874970 RepID=A0AAV1U1Y3_9STRA